MSAVKLHLFSKTTILIIEDNLSLLRVLSDKLESEGYKILAAGDGKTGLETALAEHPDLITLDMMMPEMDGLTVLKELRKDPWGKDVKVIVLSNLVRGEGATEELKSYNITEFVEKMELSLGNIVKKVEKALSQK